MSPSQPGAETTARLNATPQAATATKPAFDVAGIHAQITCTLPCPPDFWLFKLRRTAANAQAFAVMAHVQSNLPYNSKEKPSPTIMTTNEAGQVRAAVVIAAVANGNHIMMTLFQGSLAGSDSEALLSLYEESKLRTTSKKKIVEDNGRWWRG